MSPAVYIIEIGNTCWAIGQVLAVTTSCSTAWEALGAQQHGCVIEVKPGVWAACRVIDVKSSAMAARTATGKSAFESRRRHANKRIRGLPTGLGNFCSRVKSGSNGPTTAMKPGLPSSKAPAARGVLNF